MEQEPANRETSGNETRNPDGTFKPGVSGNPNGRPKDTLKAFVAREFREMNDEQKRKWLTKHKLPPELIWRMAEGNPTSEFDHKGELTTKIISADE